MKKTRPTIVMTYPFDPKVVSEELKPFAKTILVRSQKELYRRIPGADGLVCLLSTRVDSALLDRAPKLKAVGNFAVGLDNVDLPECRRRGVRVCNTPGVLTRATAETTLALLLAAARRFPEGEKLCREGRFQGWTPDLLLGLELQGRHAVLVGRGRIGKETARLFQGLGIHTEFITRRDSGAQIRAKLKRAQILSLHVPMSPETHHWLNRERIRLLPRDAIVLNASRGPLIDEKALISALRSRNIFAAGLDVFEREPYIPPALRNLQNVVLLPHLGSATREAREGMARLAMSGVVKILGGKRPQNEVKFQR